MGPEIVFPAACFMAMAVEAIYQSNEARSKLEGKNFIENPQYRLRNVTFNKALVMEEDVEHKVMLTLAPVPGGRHDWHEFVISSLNDSAWQENSRGLVRTEEEVEIKASGATMKPLTHTTPGRAWYKAHERCRLQLRPSLPETARGRIYIWFATQSVPTIFYGA